MGCFHIVFFFTLSLVATLSFLVWVHFWRLIDLATAADNTYRINKKVHNLKNWTAGHPLLQSTVAYLVPLCILDHYFPRRQLPDVAPSFVRLLCEIGGAIFLYDLFIYPVHWFFHHITCFRSFHELHHKMHALRAVDALRHSLVDGTMQVVSAVCAVNVLQAHPFSRALFNVCVTYLIVEAHCGYDFPWQSHNLVPFGLLGGSVAHERHHVSGKVHFHQFFTYLDRLFGYYPVK